MIAGIRTISRAASVLALGLLLVPGCAGQDDVLATYTGGVIKRCDLYDLIAERCPRPEADKCRDAATVSKREQRKILAAIMMTRGAAMEAKKRGLDADRAYMVREKYALYDRLAEYLFNREVRPDPEVDETAIKLGQIVFRVDEHAEKNGQRIALPRQAVEEKIAVELTRANAILAAVKKGESFEQIMKRYPANASGGHRGGYVLASMMDPAYAAAAFSLGCGEYCREPVRIGNEIYLFTVLDKKRITGKQLGRINDILGTGKSTRLIASRLWIAAREKFFARLRSAPDVRVYPDRLGSPDRRTVLFETNDYTGTVGDLYQALGRENGPDQAGGISTAKKKETMNKLLLAGLMERMVRRKGFYGDLEFKRSVESLKSRILALEYMRIIMPGRTAVTQTEISTEYRKNRERKYYRMDAGPGGVPVKVVLPFEQIANRIETELRFKKRNEFHKNLQDEIAHKYAFAIRESALEGK